MPDFAATLNQFADRTYQTAKKHGFYPCAVRDMWKKVMEECDELVDELRRYDADIPPNRIGKEAADVMIVCLNICRALDIDPGLNLVEKADENDERPYLHGRGK